VDAPPDAVLDAAGAELKARRYRTDTASDSVAAEAGHLRETGNLVFHLSLVIVLLAVALGSLYGYRGTVIVQERTGFANTLTQYDSMSAGTMFDARNLPPFALELDEFVWEVHESGPQRGSPADFEARVRFVPEPGAPEEHRSIRVNEPLEIDGTLIHILNPGYAPAVTVRDADGEILAEGPVTFLPMDDNFTSEGVRKVPVADGDDIGLEAIFFPTAAADDGGASSVFAGAQNPTLLFTTFVGDLGINDGTAQSVFRLDTSDMEQLTVDGEPFRAAISVGETIELPGGHGTVTFDGYVKWVQLQISRNSGKELALGGALLAVGGLVASLYVRRRRAWVRAVVDEDGRTVVEVAGLARSGGGDLDRQIGDIADGLIARLPAPTPGSAVRQG
jgi:cytochrome c biogenesis protein